MGGKEKEIQRGANALAVSRGNLISNSSRKPLSRQFMPLPITHETRQRIRQINADHN